MGWPEILVIGTVAMLVFGPEKLPDVARQAARFIRTVRQMAENAKADLGREMGEDLSGVHLRDLDPREVVRRQFLDDEPVKPPKDRILRPGERPPFDPDAT